MSDLDKLIHSVENGCNCVVDHIGYCGLWHHKGSILQAMKINGSLNAAASLASQLVKGCHWYVNSMGEACVMMSADGEPNFKGDSDVPSRALLIAVLKAYRSLQ